MTVSNLLSLVAEQRKNVDSISERTAQFLAAGGSVEKLPSPPHNPMPAKRSTKIDPETILKRKRPSITAADRRALREMAAEL